MKIVFSQPMYLPWQGLFDQLRHADIFVHYDDAQFTKGGFLNRVQMKTPDGFTWLTVPVLYRSGSTMLETAIEPTKRWQEKHLAALSNTLMGLPHAEETLSNISPLLTKNYPSIAQLNIALFEHLAQSLGTSAKFVRSSSLNIDASASEKVLRVVQALGGTTYITGHGARHYLDHELLERHGIATEYIDYRLPEYPQKFGAFNPYVTLLTLLAAVGPQNVVAHLTSPTKPWREFIAHE